MIERPCTPDEVAAAEAALGFAFPPSYRRFCLTYGPGLIGGHFAVATPMPDSDHPLAITVTNPRADQRFRHDMAWHAEEGFVFGVDVYEGVDPAILGRARFFGMSYNGERLFWDVRPGSDEYGIYVLGYDGSTVRPGGATLDTLIRDSQTDRIKAIFGPGYAPLPRTFARFTPRPE
ncbi:SMI1/KNR4 family protein [Methylobacterium sp. C1]|uniref:SMI1/KNR4 family protein n=1 Tax=Methylobacterium sp. C1 TaxID=1479019 RepID=UPI0013314B24|nr:SMI1/KNR4 family protein [Methylobacterium sp. C1]